MLVRHSLLYMVARGVPGIVYIVLAAAYTRFLAPTDYGLWAAAMVGVVLVSSCLFGWVAMAAMRFGTDGAGFGPGLLLAYVGTALPVMGGGLVWATASTDHDTAQVVIAAAALACVTGWLEVRIALLMGRQQAGPATRLSLLRSLCGAAGGLALAWNGAGPAGILLGTLGGMIVPAAVATAGGGWSGRTAPTTGSGWKHLRDGLRPPPGTLARLGAYGFPVALAMGLAAGALAVDRILLISLTDLATYGLYAAGADLAWRVMQSLAAPIGGAGLALANRAFDSGGQEAARRQFSRNLVLLIGVLAPATAGLALVGGELAAVILDAAFVPTAAAVIPLLALAAFLGALRANFAEHAFHVAARTGALVPVLLISMGSGVLAALLLIPALGPVGAAWAAVTGQAAGLAAALLLGRGVLALPLPGPDLAKIAVATLAMAVAVFALPAQGAAALALRVAAGALVYAGAILALDGGGARAALLRRRQTHPA